MHSISFLFYFYHFIHIVWTINNAEKQCGKVYCSEYEYCSIFNEQCEKCSSICDKTTHNYDEKHCLAYCKEYVSKEDLKDEMQKIMQQQNVILILLSILISIVLIACIIRVMRFVGKETNISSCIFKNIKLRKNLKKNQDVNKQPNCTNGPASQIFTVTGGGENSVAQTISTPISTRYPAEDSTIDYSYDNAGLQLTPTDKPN